MTKWIKGAVLALFLLSYPAIYKYGEYVKEQEWSMKYTQLVNKHKTESDHLAEVNKVKEAGFIREIGILNDASDKTKKAYEQMVADLERKHTDSMHQSTNRADIYRRQASASEAERQNLANHTARLDQALVEGKTVARELRYTLEQRENELRELGTVLKSIEKKYE